MDYFYNVLTTFQGRGSSIAVYARSKNSQISSKISEFVKVLRVWNDMRVNNQWQNFYFLGELSLLLK